MVVGGRARHFRDSEVGPSQSEIEGLYIPGAIPSPSLHNRRATATLSPGRKLLQFGFISFGGSSL